MKSKKRSMPRSSLGGICLSAALLLGGCQDSTNGDDGPGKPGGTLACKPGAVTIGPSPLRRLNHTEYRNTVGALFKGIDLPSIDLNPEKTINGFDNNVTSQAPNAIVVEQYFKAAEAIAKAVVGKLGTILPCAAQQPFDAATCGLSLVRDVVPRIYRRPLTAEENSRFTNFLAVESGKSDFPTATGMLLSALLQSPHFLYRPELGTLDPLKPTARPLSGYELASRLSYFLWQSMPDDELMAAAASGALGTVTGLRAEAERMLGDERARAAVSDFYRQWLELDRLKTISRDTALFPEFSAETPALLQQSTARYLEYTFWEGEGTLSSLLLEPKAFVNDALSPLYGVAKKGTNDLQLVELDPTQRAGLLTQAGLMAAMAHPQFDAPVLRGVFVLKRLLCSPPLPPPPDVANIQSPKKEDGPQTTRQHLERTHIAGDCKGCHASIDGIGFGFSNYDAVGQYRTMENGLPVDATGKFQGIPGLKGSFDGAVEMSKLLAKSEVVEACVSEHWFRFSMGRLAEKEDQCATQSLAQRFHASGGNFKELILSIVESDSFRYRAPVSSKP